MLILSRRIGEKIIIGDSEVEMVVISYDKGQVKLGFEADKRIKINREEVFIKVKKEQQMKMQLESKEDAVSIGVLNDVDKGE